MNMPATIRAKVLSLQEHVRQMPQVEPITNHYMAGGMYAREVFQEAGVLVIGKVHRKEHFFIVTKGSVHVVLADGPKILTAPCVLISSPGTKRALYTEEGCTYMTVHKTNKKNIAKIEKELVYEDLQSMFTVGNKLKVLK